MSLPPQEKPNEEALKTHRKVMDEYKRERKAAAITIPIDDADVKMSLRQFKQPICLFGEDAAARRERLKSLAQKTYIDKGRIPPLGKVKESKEEKSGKDDELFYTYGTEELKTARMEMALFSIPKASLRLEKARKRHAERDRLAEAEEYEKYLTTFSGGYKIVGSEYGDDRFISRGCLSPDEQLFVTAGWSNVCKVWGIPDCHIRTELKGHDDKVLCAAFHPTAGLQLSPTGPNVATGSVDCTIRLWSLNPEMEFQQSIVLGKHEERVNCVAYHPLGHYLASTSNDKTWRLWNIEQKKEILLQEGHDAYVHPLAFQCDGSLVATGDLNGVGRVWDLRTGKSIINLLGHVKRIISLAFLPNGYQMATGSDDNTVRIWDLRRRSTIYNVPAHHKAVSDIRFEPTEGKFMVTASYDGVCKLWNTRDWQVVGKFAGCEAKLTSASPNKDGSRIITTSSDRMFKVWELCRQETKEQSEIQKKE